MRILAGFELRVTRLRGEEIMGNGSGGESGESWRRFAFGGDSGTEHAGRFKFTTRTVETSIRVVPEGTSRAERAS